MKVPNSEPSDLQTMPFVSIIVPAFNEAGHVGRCMESLRAQTYPRSRYEIIVVDNDSQDDTILVARRYADLVLSVSSVNVSSVRNLGAKNAKGSIYAFIDADCVADSSWVQNAVNLINKEPCITGSRCRVPADGTWVERAWFGHMAMKRYEVVYINSGNLVVPAAIYNSLGGFNQKLISGEDYEFCLRASKRIRIISDPGVGVVHYGYPKTLRQFFSREIWHGIGAFGAVRYNWFDKPLLGTLVFLGLVFLGALGVTDWIMGGPGTLLIYSTAGMLALLGASSWYKQRLQSGVRPVLQLVVLYWLYYSGRSASLFFILGKKRFVRRR